MIAFCDSKKCTTKAQAERCYQHWVEYGRAEGRSSNPDECSRVSKYTCFNGVTTPVRINENGQIACATKDAPACYAKDGEKKEEITTKETCEEMGHTWGGQSCAWSHCKRAGPEQGTVRVAFPNGAEHVCSEEDYSQPNHWCAVAKKKLLAL